MFLVRDNTIKCGDTNTYKTIKKIYEWIIFLFNCCYSYGRIRILCLCENNTKLF